MSGASAPARELKKVVVLGGGFAGVEAATDLQKSGLFDVTLVSDRDFLYLYPISIWVTTRSIAPERTRIQLADIARSRGFDLVISAVEQVRPADNTVVCTDRDLSYDYLVVAIGADKMHHAGAEHTLSICGSPQNATAIQERLDRLVEQGRGSIAFGFGGNPKDSSAVRGGPAFELLFNVHHMLKKKGIRDAFDLTFFAPMPSPGERMGAKAVAMVGSMFDSYGIKTRYGTKIDGFDERGVMFADGSRLDADLVLYIPAGSGHHVLVESGLPLNDAGFVMIDDHCLVAGTGNVYAAGDVAALEGPPWHAKQGHLAEVMAHTAAHNMIMSEQGKAERWGYQRHVAIVCLMDTGSGAALVYRSARRNWILPLPVVGHWLKRGWGTYTRLSKTGRIPHLPGM